MAIVPVTDNSFKEEVESAETALAYFWAEWCPPCKRIAPVLEEIEKEMPDLKIVKLNVDDDPATPGGFNVMSIPTMIMFKNGQPVDRIVGFKSKDSLVSLVSRYL
jgi:thioredoxin 1